MTEKRKKSHSRRRPITYKDAGVDIDAAAKAVSAIKRVAGSTFTPSVLRGIGDFGSMFRLPLEGIDEPILVSSVDGVGTKLKLAFMTGNHRTVGIDIVSHCVNDIMVQGAEPLFFMDYIALHQMDPEVVEDIVFGLSEGCSIAGCPLIGGETAELPETYSPGEYDLVGFVVGCADRSAIVDGSNIKVGDSIVGLYSSGLHTNGYTLARKLCFDVAGLSLEDKIPNVPGNVAEALMTPHFCYAEALRAIRHKVEILGMAHITGGGITDNLPRCLPKGVGAAIQLDAWKVPPIFSFLRVAGQVSDQEMLRTFNLGIGLILVVRQQEANSVISTAESLGIGASAIGEIVSGEPEVLYRGSLAY